MKDNAEIKDEYLKIQQKLAVLAKYQTPEALFDHLFGDLGGLSKKKLAKRLDLIKLFSMDFRFMFSQVLAEKMLNHRLIETSNYLQYGLPAFRSSVRFNSTVKYYGRQYDVSWTLTPSFAQSDGSYWRVPLKLHQHERMIVNVVSVYDHLNPMIEVDHQYHRENSDVTMRLSDYYQRYLAPNTWHKLGVFDRHWVINLYLWQLWLGNPVNHIIDDELRRFGWIKPVAVRRAYLRALDQIQHGELLKYQLNTDDLLEFVHHHASFVSEPDKIKQDVIEQLMQSDDFNQSCLDYQKDLDYLLSGIFGYQKIIWEKSKLVTKIK